MKRFLLMVIATAALVGCDVDLISRGPSPVELVYLGTGLCQGLKVVDYRRQIVALAIYPLDYGTIESVVYPQDEKTFILPTPGKRYASSIGGSRSGITMEFDFHCLPDGQVEHRRYEGVGYQSSYFGVRIEEDASQPSKLKITRMVNPGDLP
ncbi:hypothetical protein [Meiothermus sp.]|uniref:hypothetical protein n=1 Tax=Meiothermus sp. TaxID=1955249 RepID=UPI00261FFC7F|nr:hypothetical protein [Meiothermus sp.]